MEKLEPYRGAAVAAGAFVALAGPAGLPPEAPFDGPTAFLRFDRADRTWREVGRRDWFGADVCATGIGTGFAVIANHGEVHVSSDAEPDGRVVPYLSALAFNTVARVGDHLIATSGAGQHMVRPALGGDWVPLSPGDYDPDYAALPPAARFARFAGLEREEDADTSPSLRRSG